MQIKNMHIKNYRQFDDIDICYDNTVTIIAGANNSGKTSLVELYRNLFEKNFASINSTDINIKTYAAQLNNIVEQVVKDFKKTQNIDDFSNKLDEFFKDNKINSIEVKIEICYEEDDEITNFADFLMELDTSNKSFYFIYKYEFKKQDFIKAVTENYGNLISPIDRYEEYSEQILKTDDIKTKSTIELLKQKVFDNTINKFFNNSFEHKFCYCNKEYENELQIENSLDFKKLFNFKRINADRNLSDEKTNNNCQISKSLINLISNNENWKSSIETIPEKITDLINNANIRNIIQTDSKKCLKTIVQEIEKTNKNKIGTPILDFDFTEDNISNFISNCTKAKYELDGYSFNEQCQGLGYSNLIYMHIQIEKFKKDYDAKLVNFFVIEEPEAHLHPQMQRVLIKHLNEYFNETNIQGLITTHSNEIVKASNIKQIRVIRPANELFKNNLYDLNKFYENLKDGDKKSFYSFLFSINYSDLIFADKIIMYEGDTEKMFFERILNLDKYESLKKQYISFVQVGGAYVNKYKYLLGFLGIKTLIFTDLDYPKEKTEIKEILEQETSNAGIIDFSKKKIIKDIYNWKQNEKNRIKLFFQTAKDGYARTLEEAILNKYWGFNIENLKNRDFWKKYNNRYVQGNNKELDFCMPNKNEISVRDIVNSTSDNKTDFMYSIILKPNEEIEKYIPNYIEEGLNWLKQ